MFLRNWGVGHYALVIIVLILISMSVVFTLNIQEVKSINRILEKIDVGDKQQLSLKPTPETKSPHAKHIDNLENDSGVRLSRLSKIIVDEEGIRSRPYKDTVGVPTIGVGRSLKTNGLSTKELFAIIPDTDLSYILENTRVKNKRVYIDTLEVANHIFSNSLSSHDIELLLSHDLTQSVNDAKSIFGDDVWNQIDAVRKEAIIDIIFNLGLPHFRSFHKFIESVKVKDWKTAARELLLSEAARENYSRYHHVSLVIDTGDEKYFKEVR